jgi:hypothetical protein
MLRERRTGARGQDQQPRRRGHPAATARTGLLINPAGSPGQRQPSRTRRLPVWTNVPACDARAPPIRGALSAPRSANARQADPDGSILRRAAPAEAGERRREQVSGLDGSSSVVVVACGVARPPPAPTARRGTAPRARGRYRARRGSTTSRRTGVATTSLRKATLSVSRRPISRCMAGESCRLPRAFSLVAVGASVPTAASPTTAWTRRTQTRLATRISHPADGKTSPGNHKSPANAYAEAGAERRPPNHAGSDRRSSRTATNGNCWISQTCGRNPRKAKRSSASARHATAPRKPCTAPSRSSSSAWD